MKRLPRLALAAALFAGALAGIPSLAFAGNLPTAIDGSVAVMHTNDIHGSYKYSYNESKGTGTVGFDGLAVLYSAQSSAPDLLLDAGDTFHGQSFATMSEGKSIAELMDTFYADGYDATTPGNHDWNYGADLAIENAGGIRGGIAAGNVTAGNVIAISPYGNTVETWTMTGADFLAALEHSLQISDDCNDSYELQQAYVAAGHTEQEAQDKYKWRDDSGSVLSFGGINVTIDWTQPEGKRIVSATLTKDGSTLDPAKTYTVATNNYIITNTTDFPTFANATKHTEWGTCESALRALIGQSSWESKMASLAGTISFGSAAVDPTPTPAPTSKPSPKTDTTTTKVITKKTTGKLAATGDRTLAVVGACLIGGIIVIILGIIWKRRR